LKNIFKKLNFEKIKVKQWGKKVKFPMYEVKFFGNEVKFFWK